MWPLQSMPFTYVALVLHCISLWSWNIFPLENCVNPFFLNYLYTFSLLLLFILASLGLLNTIHQVALSIVSTDYLNIFSGSLHVLYFYPTTLQGKYCYGHFVLEKTEAELTHAYDHTAGN